MFCGHNKDKLLLNEVTWSVEVMERVIKSLGLCSTD